MIEYYPDPIFFQFGSLTIRWYGLILALAIFICITIAQKIGKKIINTDELYDLSFWLALGGIIGARIYDVFIIEWPYFKNNLNEIWQIWHGGLAIHGAIIGGVLALFFWTKKYQKNFWQLIDLVAIVLPLGQAIGRWGNFFNQELFGRPTNLPWAIAIDIEHRPSQYLDQIFFQPVFLYESALDFLLFVCLILFFKKNKLAKFHALLIYLMGYGLIRFLMEFLRIDQTAMLGIFRLPQILSFFIAAVSLIILLSIKKRHRQCYTSN